MEAVTAHDWMVFWAFGSFFLAFICAFKLMFNKEGSRNTIPYFSNQLIYVLAILIVFYFAFEPIALYSDKWNYEFIFKSINDNNVEKSSLESGFYFYNNIIAFFSNSTFFYFLITAVFYLLGSLYFINKVFSKKARYIVFIAVISSLGFYGYGTNTIRQGLALSVFMFFFMEKRITVKLIIGSVLAILIHKSLLFVVAINFFVIKYNRKDNFIFVWVFLLLATIALGETFTDVFGGFLIDSDSRMNSYLTDEFENYETGFKINFLVYSLLPILFGRFIKKRGFQDAFFDKILSIYILINAFWLLVIRLPFTDRFAYLSWFLIPFIIIYPFSKQKIFNNQNFWIAGLIFVLAFVNLLISTK